MVLSLPVHLYDSLMGYHENIDIKIMCPNSKKQQGLTHRPMDDRTLQSLYRIPVLHSFLGTMRWYEEVAYYTNAQHFTANGEIPARGQGKRKSQDEKDAIALSKNYFLNLAKTGKLNLPLDQPGIILDF